LRWLLRFLRRALVFTGLALFLVVSALLIFEATGGVERLLRDGLERVLEDEPGLTSDVRNVRIDWLKPAIYVEGLHVQGEGGELFIEEARCVFDLSHGGGAAARIAALDVTRGRVLLSQSFIEATGRAVAHAQGLVAGPVGPETNEQTELEKPGRGLPICNLSDIEVALMLPSGERVELGTAAARLKDEHDDGLSLAGAVALAGGGTGVQPLFFRAALGSAGELRVRAATRNLQLKSRGSDLRSLLPPALQQVDLDLRASVDFEGQLAIDGSRPPQSTARVRLENGYLRPGPGLPALDEFEIDGQIDWLPKTEALTPEDLWRAARGTGTFTARVVGEAIEGSVDLPQGGQLELAVTTPNVTLDERLLEELGLPEDGPVRSNWRAFDFTGRADVVMGLRLDLTRGERPLEGLDLCLAASSDGHSSFRYNGFEVPGVGREGVPLACDQVGGAAVMGMRGGHKRPVTLGIVDVHGSHGSGEFRSNGMIVSPNPDIKQPERPWAELLPDLDLDIVIDHRVLDAELEEALDGMTGTNWIWGAFNPEGGFCNALVQLRSRPAIGGMTALVDVDAHDADMRWSELPVGLHIDDFDLQLRWSRAMGRDPRGWDWRASGGRFYATGSSASVSNLEVRGMVRSTSDAGPVEVTGAQPMHSIVVTAPGLALRGRDWEELVMAIPELAPIGEELGTKGRVDLTWVDSSLPPTGDREVAMEVMPTLVELLPKGFPMVTRDVAGRLAMSARIPFVEPGAEDTGWGTSSTGAYQGAFTARWASGMRVAATLNQPLDQTPGQLKFAAASLDPTNSALLGALASDARQPGEAPAMSTEGLALDGHFDLTGELQLTDADTPTTPDIELFLRGNSLTLDKLVLDDLQGAVTISDGALNGHEVEATLSGAPVKLTGARFVFAPTEADGATFFSTHLHAENLPLGREQMGAFLEPEALDSLLDDFDWHGSVDLEDITLVLDREPDGRLAVRISGALTPNAMHMVFGAPVDISTAEVELVEFVLEGERARAWGRVKGLFGALADREVRDGELLFSYVDQRLTIQGLDSSFAGGQLRSLGGGTATALAVDLAPPHHFSLGMELKGAEAGSLLEGAFGGAEENRGLVDAAIRFEATPGDILAASGAGWLRVREARLWSIPVFRELFKQLGFDATGVFDSMRTNFAIQDGAFELRDMKAHSPLLKLVGSGRLDMNGNLESDLEVRYGLVDKLGPLRFLVYWFQNSILRVQIRGDLHRPVVLLRNFFFDIFKSGYKNKPRLPLPYPAPLPERF